MAFQSLKESERLQWVMDYYEKLTPRDQLAVKVLAIFMAIVIIVVGLILPATRYNSEAQYHYRTSVETLDWINVNKSLFTSDNQQRVKRDPGQSLLGIANESSKKFNISFKRYEPVGDNGLSLWLDDNTVFNNMIVWLEMLDKRYGIHVKEIAVDRQDVKGLVNVRLVLQG